MTIGTHNLKFSSRFTFWVNGTPVPWSAPLIGRRGGRRKDPRLIEWQEKIHEAAKAAYGPREPYTGPVYLEFVFFVQRHKDAVEGKLAYADVSWSEDAVRFKKKGGLPDRCNLEKAAEDALQGVFFVNDGQVPMACTAMEWSDRPGVEITVGFIDGAD